MSLLSLSCLTDVQTCLDLEPWESLGLHGDQNQSKGNQSWISIGRTDTEAETPVLWPPDVKNLLVGKDPDAWQDWRWEEKETAEDEMVGWHHLLDGQEFEQAPGVGDGQKPGMLQSMGLQRGRHDWATEPMHFSVTWGGECTKFLTCLEKNSWLPLELIVG